MEYLGLFFELVLLIAGVYMYLFARGFVKAKDPELQKKAEAFRSKNAWLLRSGGLALTAVMALNLALHIRELLN
jgi:hypothetical protein